MFPTGLPGLALLLLRGSVAIALLVEAFSHHDVLSGWMRAGAILISVALSVGYLTPIVAVMALVVHGLIWSSLGVGSAATATVIALNAAALALLGPGAYSVDSYRFGRRVVVRWAEGGPADGARVDRPGGGAVVAGVRVHRTARGMAAPVGPSPLPGTAFGCPRARQRPHLAFRPSCALPHAPQRAAEGLRYGGRHGITRWRITGGLCRAEPNTPGDGRRLSGLAGAPQAGRAAIRSRRSVAAERLSRSERAPAHRSATRTNGCGRRRRACWW